MRHATVMGLNVLRPWVGYPGGTAWRRLACTWEPCNPEAKDFFNDEHAWDLLGGRRVELPTCPACAALLDLALELRGTP